MVRARRDWLAVFILSSAVDSTANVLLEARVRIVMSGSAVTCDVTGVVRLALDRGGDIEQRLQRLEGSRVELLEITGANRRRRGGRLA